ncbi:MAG: hypothetical protein E4H14_11040 [Candidatus Thorarchaeota archaeon]|nr:MAG: hypothetical protein E4H14_11040 [Candidatus Thorarchaeota archaeon]
MILASDLLERFHSLISTPVVSDTCISGECVSMLVETAWVKIMVIRYQVAPKICTIEIEVSLPNCIIEPTYPSTAAKQEESRQFINSSLAHLKYLLRLQEVGFSIGILSDEGIWSAVLKIEGEPDEKLFETILPPES